MSLVLVVEDNQDLADSLALALELDGHLVETENDGAAGLLHASKAPPNVVVLDVDLPRLNGVALARGLRQMYGNAVRLIAYTGHLDEDLVEQLVDAGVEDTILKPAAMPVLLAAVRRLAA